LTFFFTVHNELVLSRISALAYSKLFKQAIRQTEIHIATEPVRSVDADFAYKTMDRKSNYLPVPKDMLPLNNRLLDLEEYTAIDFNSFMEGLDTMGRYKYMNKVKAGLATPFHVWGWMDDNIVGVAMHFIWKIPAKNNQQDRADGLSKPAAIVG